MKLRGHLPGKVGSVVTPRLRHKRKWRRRPLASCRAISRSAVSAIAQPLVRSIN